MENFNIGRGASSFKICKKYRGILEKAHKRFPATRIFPNTSCDTTSLQSDYGYKPSISLKDGVNHFLDWYVEFYKIKI